MAKKISGAEYQLAKIFSSEFDYVIPSYQRPYAWTVDQTSELFDDLYDFYRTELDEEYFLGSIVLIKEEGIPYSQVIDGQQRLTTLTILLAAMTHLFSDEMKSDFNNYIREPGRVSQGLKPKPRLALRDLDRDFFAKYVQGLLFDELFAFDSTSLGNESQRNIQTNSRYLLEKLKEVFDGDNSKLVDFGIFVVQRCSLVAVSTSTQHSAFRIFSVMNSRGLDLQPTDILKAEVIGQLGKDKQAEYNERWEDMEVELGRSGFNDLFSYVRMIYAKEKAKRALLEEFKSQVISKISTPVALIEDVLEPYADALAIVKHANYEASSNAQDVNSYLKWLNRIDNSDWIPPAILFLAKHKQEPDYVLWFFHRLERLAACMHVCARNINERIERYSRLINGLDKPHSMKSPVAEVELSDAEKMAMFQALNGSVYELTARRRNYIILRLDAFMSDGAAVYDPSVLTIEHVLPQTVNSESEWSKIWPIEEQRLVWTHRIANLVPLNFRRNVSASNYDFERKKIAYFGGKKQVSSYVLTTQVLNTPAWTVEYVEKRQLELMSVFADKWNLTI